MKVAPELGHAFSVGTTNLAAATQLNDALLESSQALAEFAANPIAQVGLEEFTNTLETANPLLAGIAPSQGFCNYWTLAFRNVASLEAENIGIGTLARAGFVLAPTGPNNEGYPASAPANGPSEERHAITHVIEDTHNNHLHANMYPNTAGPGQPQVCEAGNETYIPAQTTIGNLPAADVTKNREFTSREQNLYGEKYADLDAASTRAGVELEGEEEVKLAWRRHDEIPVVELLAGEPRACRRDPDRRAGDRRVLRLHQEDPVQTRVHDPRRVRLRAGHPPEIPGPGGGRERRPGHLDQARRQRPAW